MSALRVVVGTGHRPERLSALARSSDEYDRRVDGALELLLTSVLVRLEPEWVISGMALGFDMALAQAAWNVGIPFIAAVPGEWQARRWSEHDQARWMALCNRADDVVVVEKTGGYEAWKMHRRNEWMCNQTTPTHNDSLLLSLFDGDLVSTSGTRSCRNYAMKIRLPILELWDEWTALCRRAYPEITMVEPDQGAAEPESMSRA